VNPSAAPQTVLVLYSVIDQWERGEPHELLADAETAETAAAVVAGLQSGVWEVTHQAVRTLDDVRAALVGIQNSTTLVFNLCEALGGSSGDENAVPELLDAQRIAYVGGDSQNLAACLDKVETKAHLRRAGLPTAAAQLFATGQEPCRLPFPLLIKTLYEDSSVGLSPNSLVWNEAELRRQVAYVLRVYRQPAFAEQFLHGREFYASLWEAVPGEPTLLAISQADYSTAPQPDLAFDHFEAKWQNTYPSICPAPIPADLWAKIAAIAQAAYRTMGCRDYARVDLREEGDEIYILEVNPNPALHPDAGFAKAARYAGISFADLTHQLVKTAWQRRNG
jgi:D-alanine-D-alanine ligase